MIIIYCNAESVCFDILDPDLSKRPTLTFMAAATLSANTLSVRGFPRPCRYPDWVYEFCLGLIGPKSGSVEVFNSDKSAACSERDYI